MAREVASVAGLTLVLVSAVAAPRVGHSQSANEPRSATTVSVASRIVGSAERGAFEPCGATLTIRPVIDSAAGTGTSLRAVELRLRGRATQRFHPAADAVLLVTRGWGEVTAGGETTPLGPGSVIHVPAGLRYALASRVSGAGTLELLLTLRPLPGAAARGDRATFGCESSSAASAPAASPSGRLLVIDPTAGERIAYCVFPLTITAQVDSDAAPGARLTAAMGSLRQGTEGAVHRGDDELAFVTHGTGRAFVGSDTAAVMPGSAVFIPRGLRHGFINEGRGTLEYFIVFSEPGPRELFRLFAARSGPFCASSAGTQANADVRQFYATYEAALKAHRRDTLARFYDPGGALIVVNGARMDLSSAQIDSTYRGPWEGPAFFAFENLQFHTISSAQVVVTGGFRWLSPQSTDTTRYVYMALLQRSASGLRIRVEHETERPASAQQQPPTSPVTRTDLLKQVLPPGDFRDVQAVVIELQPGAAAPRHRHDVAVLAYVLEGTVENRFDGGAVQTHKTGESWWEPPGTVHDTARNASTAARARLLIVYIGETGKAQTVRLEPTSRFDQ